MHTTTKANSKYSLLATITVTLLFVVSVGKFLSSVRILPDICHWDSVVPRLNHFWRYCVLPEILGRWYTQKRNLSQPSSGLSSVCFCRMNTAEAVVTCSNQACPISTFHLTCLKVQMVPNKWFCPLCQKSAAARKTS